MSAPKKARYSTKFNREWLKNENYKQWLKEESQYIAKCSLCGNKTFTIQHEGESAIKAHMKSKNHQKLQAASQESNLLTTYYAEAKSSLADRVTISEIALVYHNVKHMLSYKSLDCGTRLACSVFGDSKVAPMIHSGRTKSAAIVENVLGPRAIQLVLEELKEPNGECRPFSISSDASNKGNYII